MFERIKEILLQYTGSEGCVITESSNLKEDLNLDSFDIMNIVIELEDVFGIRLSDKDTVKLITVKDIQKVLAGKDIN